MAYNISKKFSYLKKVEIDLSEQLNCEDVKVILREPSTKEAFSLRADDEEKAVEAFRELLPSLIIDHNFFMDDDNTIKADNSEVVGVIFDNFQAFQAVLSGYTAAVFQAK